jgi:hypothetical protein
MTDLLMIVAVITGPVFAVLITLAWENLRRKHEQKRTLLVTLLTTRGNYADPGYSWSIRTIPIYFGKSTKVMKAYENYLDSTRITLTEDTPDSVAHEMQRRESLLISAILVDLGHKTTNSQELEVYTATALTEKELLIYNALKSMPEIATAMQVSAEASHKMAEMGLKRSDTN